MADERFLMTGGGRVFLQVGGAEPNHATQYLGTSRMEGFTESLGDVTPVRIPSQSAYDQFDTVDVVRGERGLPTATLVARFGISNELMTLNCPSDFSIHFGICEDPSDFNMGWRKIIHFEKAYLTSRSSDTLTALDEADRAQILLTGEITARQLWEANLMALTETLGTEITEEAYDVTVSDYVACGDCGYESDGNQRIFILASGESVGSPSLAAEVIISEDQGATGNEYDIDTIPAGEVPSAIEVVGPNIVVTNYTGATVNYAPLSDPNTWTAPTGTLAEEPNDIFSASATQTWIVCDGGYIYFIDDPTDPIANHAVQADGTVTGEDLNTVHGLDDGRNVIAGGDNGALVVTSNAGVVWAESPTTPTADNILCVWMRTTHRWLVGDDGGSLWYTGDAGATWAELALGAASPSEVWGISFADHPDSPFGFVTARIGAQGSFIWRTLDGGESWYELPDTAGTTPANSRLNAIATGLSSSFCVAVGLDGADGICIVGA